MSASLVGILTGRSYYISSLMSEIAGPFACFELNKPHMLRVIRNLPVSPAR